MFILRTPLVRIAITLVLLGLLSLSVVVVKNIITATWQSDRQEGALYKRSPNCFPHQDPSEVDASLPPCQNVMVTVIDKPQNTVVDHYRYHDYPKTHLLLTLQDTNGQTQTVGDIYKDMWNSIHIGDQVSVTLWRNQVREVDANGYSSPIFDPQKWNKAEANLWPWIVVALMCSFSISLLWRLGRIQTISSSFLP